MCHVVSGVTCCSVERLCWLARSLFLRLLSWCLYRMPNKVVLMCGYRRRLSANPLQHLSAHDDHIVVLDIIHVMIMLDMLAFMEHLDRVARTPEVPHSLALQLREIFRQWNSDPLPRVTRSVR